ncbi:MAG: MBL fold metallo-hydrolase [Pseudomonadales bacterium]|jgi:glyoxylase-like metal-dependent hydrolase (beta-lactamase superfamily II)/rhodanese-related sulfurtransferase|nr:MBL fold metallo-hydrolase [Pseudomonadales bacterium]MBP6228896.1 MBL fold metallo-hydrolase [Pseudomonadales bacterium]
MLLLRQLIDPTSSTYTYLLADGASGKAVLIDSVFEQARRDAALIEELGLELVATLETHVHADHVTASWLHRRRFGSVIALARVGAAQGADRYLEHGDSVGFGKRKLRVRATPGHTSGCLSYVLDDESMAFTGDCLLIRGSGRTDFQQGDARLMYRSVHTQLFTLPRACLLYPAHDYRGLTVTSVGEEMRFNPRLGGEISEDDFVGYMSNLQLAHPRQIDVAVPANLRCGEPDVQAPGDEQDWAPLGYTFGGIWEISPQALEEIIGTVQIVDVREPEEYVGPLGYIDGARLVPLGQLATRSGEFDRERGLVTVCRAGARSAQAYSILQKAGFTKLANLSGGMLRWRAQGHAVRGGSE